MLVFDDFRVWFFYVFIDSLGKNVWRVNYVLGIVLRIEDRDDWVLFFRSLQIGNGNRFINK